MKKRTKGWHSIGLLLLCAALAACSGQRQNGNESGNAGETPAAPGVAQKTSDGKTVVTMSVMTKDRFLTQAERLFEAAHPDIDVQIVETVPADTSGGDQMIVKKEWKAGSETNAEDIEKYANSVNTAIMSGQASDIISAEYLPIDKYAEKGLLADWNELAEQDADFAKSDYYENVLSAVTDDTGWYGIPTSFALEVMLGDEAFLTQNGLDQQTWTWDQFVDLLNKTKADGKYGISRMSPEMLLAFLVETTYDQLVKRDGSSASFDAAAFQAYMEKIKKLYDDGLATADMMGAQNTAFSSESLDSPMNALLVPTMSGQKNMLQPPGTGDGGGIPFKSNQVLGLNAKSNVKNEAWSFVKFLLSEEMQADQAMMNFPVNKAALSAKLTETRQLLEGSASGKDGPKITLRNESGEVKPTITDEDIQKVLDFIPSVGKYGNRDPKVLGMIAEETAAFFSGSKKAEAVSGALANRIDTYLNE